MNFRLWVCVASACCTIFIARAARDDFGRSLLRFAEKKTGNVAFLGGSITEMDGYRPMVAADLKQRFPETSFSFTTAGISSTCSDTGAFRLRSDVLDKGVPDLLFVDFSVNDDQDGHFDRAHCIRGMEGVLRQARRANPAMDLVVVMFVNRHELDLIEKGITPIPYDAHTAVAMRYGARVINVGADLAASAARGGLSWKDYRNEHPSEAGNRFVADLIKKCLNDGTKRIGVSAALPPPLDSFAYATPVDLPFGELTEVSGWSFGPPDWKKIGGYVRPVFTSVDFFSAERPGASFTASFTGTALAAFVAAGHDSGHVEVSVDAGPFVPVEVRSSYSPSLHYPRTVILADGLKKAPHRVRVRTVASKEGGAVRIRRLSVNRGCDD